MANPQGNDGDKPLISARHGPLIAGVASIITTVVIWGVTEVIDINARIDKLETLVGAQIDSDGRPIPSETAIRTEAELRVLEQRVDRLFIGLDRIQDVLFKK